MDEPKGPDFRVPIAFATGGAEGRKPTAFGASWSDTPTPVAASPIPLWLLLLGMGLPTLVTWIYFDALSQSDRSVQQLAYAVGKGTQFLLPLLAWWRWRQGWDRGLRSPNDAGSGPAWLGPVCTLRGGLCLGIAIATVMALLYFFWLEPLGVMEPVRIAAEEKLHALGLDSPSLLVAVALFYAVIHSGFEELYWRRFIFCGLTTHSRWWVAVLLSSLAFMAHHVLVLARFFGWLSLWTYLFALGVAVGGGIWATMLWYSRKWIPAWISHGIVDAAIFLIALRLLYGS